MGIDSWLFVDEKLNDSKINEIEKSFGIKFPSDYRKCIINNNGGFPEPNIFDCDDGRIEVVFNNLISFTNKDLNIKMYEEFSSKKLFPFARDPFGNLICFDYRDNQLFPEVVFYDYDELDGSVTNTICKSFTDLLERLYSLNEI
ncbi:SMI1/KNR4 family protein [Bacillus sp. N1-1]|uniref:SMI1/KNR4 family protein n=1 Tax=Bacillus sp. N1-1 TaxID=2682541 RepID=UPI001318063A|nr:SMI1/KNR4 family protein [Bacillus sp. N1-1]QHA91158.1 SMI1/KNR4 family protein [Bacillus sp. N1-1]